MALIDVFAWYFLDMATARQHEHVLAALFHIFRGFNFFAKDSNSLDEFMSKKRKAH